MDKEQGAPFKESYEAGQKAGREEAAKTPGGNKPAAKKAAKKPAQRRPPQSLRTARRQLASPVRAQLTGGFQLLGMALGLVALYDILTNAPAVSGVLGGFSRGLSWLAAPDRTVPVRRH